MGIGHLDCLPRSHRTLPQTFGSAYRNPLICRGFIRALPFRIALQAITPTTGESLFPFRCNSCFRNSLETTRYTL